MKECRRLASRYDKYARCYLAMVKLAFIRRCFRKLDFSDTA
jgi:transposase